MLRFRIRTVEYALCVGFLFLLFSCAGIRRKPVPSEPVIRVGLYDNREEIRFVPHGELRIITRKEMFRFDEPGMWHAKLSSSVAPSDIFRILLFESSDREEASEFQQNLVDYPETELSTIGERLATSVDRRRYRVLFKKIFSSEQEAEAYLSKTPFARSGTVIREFPGLNRGEISLTSPSGKELLVDSAFRISCSSVTLQDVPSGVGYHYENTQNRDYRGEIEVRIDGGGGLMAINVLPLELYILGVLPGEMSATFPLEALKAQAIAARTFFMYQFGKVHREDPYDVCDDVHCQHYIGIGEESKNLLEAVAQTRGLVLVYDDQLVSTPYSAICGGHTENAENVWSGSGEPHLKGRFDSEVADQIDDRFDLREDDKTALWVSSRPDVFCNIERQGSPDFAAYSEKYFRWQVKVKRSDLEKNINEKTGKDIGSLVNILPVKRGHSGRLMHVRIEGTDLSIDVKKELEIRRVFSPTALYSACFIVEKIGGNGRLADEFVFKGAGWGHGVGMCQIGAAMMAKGGKSCLEILSFYYRGTQVKRLY
jgi:stage II sporulation protein D